MQNTQSNASLQPVSLLPKLERKHLHDTVVEHLRRFIVEGLLSPGMKLNERELCETLEISRTPLREALKVLAAEGLIDLLPNKGASVSRMTETEVWEMFELMSGLEAFAGELACERITPAELAEIKALHYAMLACRVQDDLPGYYARNQAIHNRIVGAARNAALSHAYLSMNPRLHALRFRSNYQSDKWDRAVDEHEGMIAALEARDGKALASILRHHLLEKRDTVLQIHPDPVGDRHQNA